jgi:hypothetical protein
VEHHVGKTIQKTTNHGMKAYGSEWSASRPCHFTPGETGGWVGPRTGLNAVE